MKKISVIMPVYNEESTVRGAIMRTLNKEIDGFCIELIVVESNSTDGTRKAIESIDPRSNLTVIYEESPNGKGSAVRKGLNIASGEYVIIQDADDEYDVNDYDALIKHLDENNKAFVLGARIGKSSLRMRNLEGQPVREMYLNIGHWFFCFLIYVLYGAKLKDPATMYKVFRIDAIDIKSLRRNGFDFDWELLIHLIKKGHVPDELPISYASRNYNDGKKIKLFSDPIKWVLTIISMKFQS